MSKRVSDPFRTSGQHGIQMCWKDWERNYDISRSMQERKHYRRRQTTGRNMTELKTTRSDEIRGNKSGNGQINVCTWEILKKMLRAYNALARHWWVQCNAGIAGNVWMLCRTVELQNTFCFSCWDVVGIFPRWLHRYMICLQGMQIFCLNHQSVGAWRLRKNLIRTWKQIMTRIVLGLQPRI